MVTEGGLAGRDVLATLRLAEHDQNGNTKDGDKVHSHVKGNDHATGDSRVQILFFTAIAGLPVWLKYPPSRRILNHGNLHFSLLHL